jgi:ATP-dependent helicase HrpA
MQELAELEKQIPKAMRCDQHRLRQRMRSLKSAAKQKKPFDKNLGQFRNQLDKSVTRRANRETRKPKIDYSSLSLPVLDRRDDIADAIRNHQVVVICGETGSGKSTQLPKIALDMGRGVGAMIGHTQPRRIAARSIAARVADELGCEVGTDVGFKVRFADATKPSTYIKLMTDGILLAETAGDRFLDNYDTIIIDEAHERSLNIDFLLGYLKRLLPKRRDLKLIITSATIDAKRFQEHFQTPESEVPILEVSGRTYPVDVRYRPPEEDTDPNQPRRHRDTHESTLDALDEVVSDGPGDVLVFLPTERDIRELSRRMRGRLVGCDVLPLYGRLSPKDQSRVFAPSKTRRIVLATNVAESSVTVPGIRYVVDTGTARISRYSSRSRIQRLPIEAVSQASANQRAGRCGRIGPGICVRLYAESDYKKRDEYTQPEILRSNLASVILRAKALRLGAVEEFPFVDPPRPATIRDGYRTLYELGAVDETNELTSIGRTLSKLPVDPRIGRMVLAGIDEHCLREVLVLAAVLEIQDPRDRPVEKQQAADEAHEKFRHDDSDFLSLLNVWNFFHEQKQALSHSKLRKACLQNFLNYNRMREWVDLNRQLRDLIERNDDQKIRDAAKSMRRQTCDDYDAIHRALLTGLLSGIAFKGTEDKEYTGADQIKLSLWPGSVLAAKKPKWIIASELVETSKRYARTVARVNPNWIEPLSRHLVKRSHSEPHWHAKSSSVMAFEKATLFGLTIVARRRVGYGNINREASREIFIRTGLVAGEFETKSKFFQHNQSLVAELDALQQRTRKIDVTIDEETQFDFYDRLIPKDVCSGSQFDKWRKRAESKNAELLYFRREDFLRDEDTAAARQGFPEELEIGVNQFPLQYNMDIGAENDGITLTVPRAGLSQIPSDRLGWLVPGLLEEKVIALIKSLPKTLRRRLVPAPDTAAEVVKLLKFGDGQLEEKLAYLLTRVAGDIVSPQDFDQSKLPGHLRMNVQVIDDEGDDLAAGRDVEDMQKSAAQKELSAELAGDWTKDGLREWTIDKLPVSVDIMQSGILVPMCPTLVDTGDDVNLRLLDDPATSLWTSRAGVRRLFLLAERKRIINYTRNFPGIDGIRLVCSAIAGMNIDSQIMEHLADRAMFEEPTIPRSKEQFDERVQAATNFLSVAVQDAAALLPNLFADYQTAYSLATTKCPHAWKPSYTDARRQLEALVCPDFLINTPWQWLAQFPRYLQAICFRLERLPQGTLNNDQRGTKEIAAFENRYRERIASHRSRGIIDQEIVSYRWMLEEYRVSLFAQKLGTAVPVSAKRLERQWKKVRA